MTGHHLEGVVAPGFGAGLVQGQRLAGIDKPGVIDIGLDATGIGWPAVFVLCERGH